MRLNGTMFGRASVKVWAGLSQNCGNGGVNMGNCKGFTVKDGCISSMDR